MNRFAAILMTIFSTYSLAHASEEKVEQPTRKFSIFSMTFEKSPMKGKYDSSRDELIHNIVALIQETQPDIISFHGDTGRVEAIAKAAKRLKYGSHAYHGNPTTANEQLVRSGEGLKVGYNGAKYGCGTTAFNGPWTGTPYQYVYARLSSIMGIGAKCHGIDIGPMSDCKDGAASIIQEWAREDKEELQDPLNPVHASIFVGGFNGTPQQLKILEEGGLVKHGSNLLKFMGTQGSDEQSIDRASLNKVCKCECDDVLFAGKFKTVQTYLLPINVIGIMYRAYTMNLFGEGDLFMPLARHLPILAVFELPVEEK